MMLNKKIIINKRILGEVLRASREERGLSQEELAEIACLRKWQIKELEEAETFLTFYTMAIKIMAAKRIGIYLGLLEDQFLSTNEEMGWAMYWTIKVRHFDASGSHTSKIRIYGENLREAMTKALDIYRKSSLVSYRLDDGPEIEFESSN